MLNKKNTLVNWNPSKSGVSFRSDRTRKEEAREIGVQQESDSLTRGSVVTFLLFPFLSDLTTRDSAVTFSFFAFWRLLEDGGIRVRNLRAPSIVVRPSVLVSPCGHNKLSCGFTSSLMNVTQVKERRNINIFYTGSSLSDHFTVSQDRFRCCVNTSLFWRK